MIALGLAMIQVLAASTPQQTAQALGRTARCVMESQAAGAEALAGSIPGSTVELTARDQLEEVARRCLTQHQVSDTSENRSLLTGAIAELAYRRQVGDRRVIVRISYPSSVTLEQIVGVRTQDWPRAAAMAECLVSANWELTDRVIRRPAGSGAEQRAFQALSTLYPSCVDQGSQVLISPIGLRAELARALYRWLRGVRSSVEELSGRAE